MRTRAELTIGAVAAGPALIASGAAGGSRARRDHAKALSQEHVQQVGLSVADVKNLTQLMREHFAAMLRAAERAQRR